MVALLIALLPVIVFIPDLFRTGNVIYQITTFHSELLSFIFLFTLALLRVITKKPLILKKFDKNLLFATLLLTIFSLSGILITFQTSPNFIYSISQLRLEILCFMSAAAAVVWIIQKDNSFFKKNFRKIVLFLPVVFLGFCTLMFFLPYEVFNDVVKEDSIVEYSQFIVLLCGGIVSFMIALKGSTSGVYKLLFFASGIILLFIAGDEIAWAQRIFNLTTPEAIYNINYQGEITVHNIGVLHGLAPVGYILLGFWGSIASFFIRGTNLFSQKFRSFLVPERFFFFFFFFPFLYNFYTFTNDHFLGRFTEPIELVLYSGITLFLIKILVGKKITP